MTLFLNQSILEQTSTRVRPTPSFSALLPSSKVLSASMMLVTCLLCIQGSAQTRLTSQPSLTSQLPDIGTPAAATLSIAKEIQYGDASARILQATQPVLNDPLLNQYINGLGSKLVAYASDVKTPFSFYFIQNPELNAFATFGGHVVLFSGLMKYVETEGELASVMAHEIAHVTQRHVVRMMEKQAKLLPATTSALIGSLLLAIVSPEAGIAALSATQAGHIQAAINFTRKEEEEADRMGIQTLWKAGYDALAMPRLMSRLADQFRVASEPPPMLLTHPLPTTRLTDMRNRVRIYSKRARRPSLAFELTRVRILALYDSLPPKQAIANFAHNLKTATPTQKTALQYGKAIASLRLNQCKIAADILFSLHQKDPVNIFYLDGLSDVYIKQNHPEKAIKLLRAALANQPNHPVLIINYANALIEHKDYKRARQILLSHTHKQPKDITAWQLLRSAHQHLNQQDEALAAEAEIFALQAQWDQAIDNYSKASQLVKLNSLAQARYDARIDQLSEQRKSFLALKP